MWHAPFDEGFDCPPGLRGTGAGQKIVSYSCGAAEAFSTKSVKNIKTWLTIKDAVRRRPLWVVPVSQRGTAHYYAHNRFFSLSLKFTGPWSAGPASWRNGSIQELFKLGEYA